MAAPVISGTQCTATSSPVATFPVQLPPWTPGDLVVIAISTRANLISGPAGWTVVTSQQTLQLNSRIFYRIMQPGDSDPVFDPISNAQCVALAVTIDFGTYETPDPIDNAPADGNWGEGSSTVITTNDLTTIANDALAIAAGFVHRGHELVLTAPGWAETLTDCATPVSTSGIGGELAQKAMPSAGLTGAASWNIIVGANRSWNGVVFSIKPFPAPSGVTVDVPLHSIPVTELLPTVETITQVNVPEATYTITVFVPRAGAGTLVRVPVNTANVQQYPPTLPVGDEVFVPLHIIPVTERIPEIRTGARVPVPTFPKSGTPFPPTVGVATLVRVPLNTLAPNERVPSVGTGARVDIPELDTLIPIEYVPTVTATPGSFVFVPLDVATVQAFPPIVEVFVAEELPRIETDRDRLSLFIDEPSKLDFAGKSYMVASAEVDGDTLDGGRTTDGYIEVLMLRSEAQNIPELATVRLNGVNRTVSKIYEREGGMALLYLT